MQSKIKFPEKIRRILYRSTFLQNISVLIVNTVQLDDFRSDNTRFGRPHIITRISRLAGLAVKDLGIRLAFTLFDHYREKYTALAEHHQTPKMK